jgi:hypothetical protein
MHRGPRLPADSDAARLVQVTNEALATARLRERQRAREERKEAAKRFTAMRPEQRASARSEEERIERRLVVMQEVLGTENAQRFREGMRANRGVEEGGGWESCDGSGDGGSAHHHTMVRGAQVLPPISEVPSASCASESASERQSVSHRGTYTPSREGPLVASVTTGAPVASASVFEAHHSDGSCQRTGEDTAMGRCGSEGAGAQGVVSCYAGVGSLEGFEDSAGSTLPLQVVAALSPMSEEVPSLRATSLLPTDGTRAGGGYRGTKTQATNDAPPLACATAGTGIEAPYAVEDTCSFDEELGIHGSTSTPSTPQAGSLQPNEGASYRLVGTQHSGSETFPNITMSKRGPAVDEVCPVMAEFDLSAAGIGPWRPGAQAGAWLGEDIEVQTLTVEAGAVSFLDIMPSIQEETSSPKTLGSSCSPRDAAAPTFGGALAGIVLAPAVHPAHLSRGGGAGTLPNVLEPSIAMLDAMSARELSLSEMRPDDVVATGGSGLRASALSTLVASTSSGTPTSIDLWEDGTRVQLVPPDALAAECEVATGTGWPSHSASSSSGPPDNVVLINDGFMLRGLAGPVRPQGPFGDSIDGVPKLVSRGGPIATPVHATAMPEPVRNSTAEGRHSPVGGAHDFATMGFPAHSHGAAHAGAALSMYRAPFLSLDGAARATGAPHRGIVAAHNTADAAQLPAGASSGGRAGVGKACGEATTPPLATSGSRSAAEGAAASGCVALAGSHGGRDEPVQERMDEAEMALRASQERMRSLRADRGGPSFGGYAFLLTLLTWRHGHACVCSRAPEVVTSGRQICLPEVTTSGTRGTGARHWLPLLADSSTSS